jgi:hypothetical protein
MEIQWIYSYMFLYNYLHVLIEMDYLCEVFSGFFRCQTTYFRKLPSRLPATLGEAKPKARHAALPS